jgi:prolipoprotein diacylglyceryltransferase
MVETENQPAKALPACAIHAQRPSRTAPPVLPEGAVLPAVRRPAAREFVMDVAPARAVPPRSATPPAPTNKPRTAALDSLRRDVSRGLRYTHLRANLNTAELIQIASLAQATREVLEGRKLVAPQELERRREAAADRFSKHYSSRGMGVSFSQFAGDKYEDRGGVEIDCESRLHLCQAACCKLRFALSRQDVEEGLLRWDFGRPYLIAQGTDSYCVHLDRERKCCSVYEARPHTCRGYDCRRDARIWIDFEKRIINPSIQDPDRTRRSEPSGAAAVEASEDQQEAPTAAPETEPGLFRLIQALAARPVLYRLGNRYLSAYGVFLSLGFGTGALYWLAWIGRRFGQPLPPWYFLAGLVVAAFAGSRLLLKLENAVGSRLGQTTISRRGQTFYGGLLGALLYAAGLAVASPQNLLLFADCAAPAIGIGYAFAKLGCLASGCCIGHPTSRRFSVRYSSEASKAVAFYDLKGTPLLPLQLYEAALGLGLFALLSALPATLFGQGRVIGLFLLLLTAGRTLLMPLRFRFADERAAPLFSSLIHVVLAGAGAFLLAKGLAAAAPAWSVTRAPATAAEILFGAAAMALVVLYLFGVHGVDREGGPSDAA